MHELIRLAHERNCNRIEWTTDHGNSLAQAFYEGIGASRTSKIVYRLEGDRLIALAKELG